MATLHPLDTQRLVSLAKPFQITRASAAAGRCLSVSLDFAVAAEARHGTAVTLVRWRVVGDPHYVDHWAVRLDGENVLDLTRVQVDGRRRLVGAAADYPAHFVERRDYPAALLTAAYVAAGGHDAARLSNRFLWTCGMRLLGFDLAAARRDRDLRRATAALGEAQRFALCFGMGWLTRTLDARCRRLLARLHEQPDMAARTTGRAAGDVIARTDADADADAVNETRLAVSAQQLSWVNATLTPAMQGSLSSACSLLLACA